MPIVLGRKPGGGGGSGGGVTSLAESGQPALTGAVTLSEGTGVTLTQVGQDIEIASTGAGLFDAYAIIRDEKANNTGGGDFTSGAWRTRDLNTEVYDPTGIVSIAANQFTLQAGTYLIRATAPAYNVNAHKSKIRNVTDGADSLIGSSEQAQTTGSAQTISVIVGVITIAGAKAFEVQHLCQTTQAAGLGMGVPTNAGVVEVYTQVEIWREA